MLEGEGLGHGDGHGEPHDGDGEGVGGDFGKEVELGESRGQEPRNTFSLIFMIDSTTGNQVSSNVMG